LFYKGILVIINLTIIEFAGGGDPDQWNGRCPEKCGSEDGGWRT
jgi:hypothetical protein